VPSFRSFHCLTGVLPNVAAKAVCTAGGGVTLLSSVPCEEEEDEEDDCEEDELSSPGLSFLQENSTVAVSITISNFFIVFIFLMMN
jgi:hypothetical protein